MLKITYISTIPVSVKRALPLRESVPCKTAAESALQPLSWRSESLSSHASSSEDAFSQRPV